MFVFETLNENTEVRDNIFNDELNDTDIFSGLSEELSNDIIKSVNGVGFDANGNILGADGKVLLEPSALRQNIKEYYNSLGGGGNDINPADYESVEIDGVAYTINDKGEAVDAEGKIVKTPDEVKAIIAEHGTQQPETIEEVVAAANEGLGIDFKDEEGNPITFDINTVEGMQARDQFIVDNLAEKLANDRLDEVFGSDPDFESLYLHKRKHGSADGWSPTVDYSKITLLDSTADGAEDQYRDVIIKAEIAAGRDAEAAKQFAQYLIDDGKGEEAAKKALGGLQATEAARIEAARIADQEAIEARNKEITEYWGGIESLINNGKVGDVTIPAFISVKQEDGSIKTVPRRVLYEYMSKPVKDGMSQDQIDARATTPEQKIVNAYLRLTKTGTKDLVNQGVKQEKVKLIRKAKAANPAGNVKTFQNGKAPNDSVIL